MSLADVLKADLEDDDDLDNQQLDYADDKRDDNNAIEDVTMVAFDHQEQEQQEHKWNATESVRMIAKLMDSKHLHEIIEKILDYQRNPRSKSDDLVSVGQVEQDPEYKLIVEANNLTVEIDVEINIIHKYIRDKYAKRFPELESLVPPAMDYIRTVRILGKGSIWHTR
jgi:U4/U6 small nuclear ribonucleoprotein PRP31